MTSKIEWTDTVWEPVGGCRHASEGCRNCYAETLLGGMNGLVPSLFSGRGGKGNRRYDGLVELKSGRSRFTGEIAVWPDKLVDPLRWRKPRTAFVCSQSDLFYEARPFAHIAAVYAVMAAAAWVGAERNLRKPMTTGTKFLVLTKRAARRREFFDWLQAEADRDGIHVGGVLLQCLRELMPTDYILSPEHVFAIQDATMPLPNVGEGVSVEDQATADERIPVLLGTPAAMRFVSYEPALGPVDFEATTENVLDPECWGDCNCDAFAGYDPGCRRNGGDGRLERRVDWVIAGAESGPGARPAPLDWFRSVRDQCKNAGVAFFLKQADICALCGGTGYEQPRGVWCDGCSADDGTRCWRPVAAGQTGKVRKGCPELDGQVHDARPAWLTGGAQ